MVAQAPGPVATPVPTARLLPSGTPTPSCWLDASNAASLFRDVAGTTPAVANVLVRLWKDRSGNNRHCTFGAGAAGATWATGGAYAINQLPVLLVPATGPGSFATSPVSAITASSGYTIMAVWRIPVSGGGGHPLGCSATTKLGPTGWLESIETGTVDRTMPNPAIAAGDIVAAEWTRTGTAVSFRLASATGAWEWAGTVSPSELGWVATSPAVGRGGALHLAELLVWPVGLTGTQAAAVKTYLAARWGVAPPLAGAVATPAVLPSLPVASSNFFQLEVTATQYKDTANAGTTFTARGGTSIIADASNPGKYLAVFSGTTPGGLTTSTGLVLPGDFTVQVIFQLTTPVITYQSILHIIGDLMFHMGSGQTLYFRIDTEVTYLNMGYIAANAWHRLTAQRIGSTIRVYLNGTLKLTYTSTKTVNAGGVGMRVGWGSQNVVEFPFRGQLRSLQIFKGTAPADLVL